MLGAELNESETESEIQEFRAELSRSLNGTERDDHPSRVVAHLLYAAEQRGLRQSKKRRFYRAVNTNQSSCSVVMPDCWSDTVIRIYYCFATLIFNLRLLKSVDLHKVISYGLFDSNCDGRGRYDV